MSLENVTATALTPLGTLITNFQGPFRLAEELSTILTNRVLEDHPMGRQSLGCPWILAFAMLRTMAEQLDFAFELFDPVGVSSQLPVIPRLEELPQILEKSDRLARLSRYLSSLDEFVSFFTSVKQLLPLEPISDIETDVPAFRSVRVKQFAQLEVSRAQHKIQYQQRLCETYSRQSESLVQLVISYSTTQITERLDQGRRIADQFAKIGMFLAGLAGLVAPMSLLTGFYGMNVKEFTEDATATLFEFWQIGIPVVLVAGLSFAFLTIWTLTQPKQMHRGTNQGDRGCRSIG